MTNKKTLSILDMVGQLQATIGVNDYNRVVYVENDFKYGYITTDKNKAYTTLTFEHVVTFYFDNNRLAGVYYVEPYCPPTDIYAVNIDVLQVILNDNDDGDDDSIPYTATICNTTALIKHWHDLIDMVIETGMYKPETMFDSQT